MTPKKAPKPPLRLHLDSGRVSHRDGESHSKNYPIPWCAWQRCKLGGSSKAPELGEPTTYDRRRTGEISCPECAVFVKETTNCYGCKKPLPLAKVGESEGKLRESMVCELELVGEIPGVRDEPRTVLVCGNVRTASYSGYARRGKSECVFKARERAEVCPGCGEGASHTISEDGLHSSHESGTPLGELCGACRDRLSMARELERSGEVKWYRLPPSVLFPRLWDGRHEEHSFNKDRAALLLARACAGRGKRAEEGRVRGEAIITAERSQRDGEGPSVELTEDQAVALRELCVAIHDAVEVAYRKGASEGRSLLYGLAAGKLTVDELNKRTIDQGKQHKLMDDEAAEED